MSIQIKGIGGAVAETDDNHHALRVALRPVDVGALGSYRKSMLSAIMAAGLGSNSPIFSFRYGGANLCIPRRVIVSAGDLVGFTAGFFNLQLFAARSFSASDSGGAAGALTGNNAKLRTAMAQTGVADFRIASTGTLTTGTRTLDAEPLGAVATSVITTAGQPIIPPTDLLQRSPDEWPLICANNEGFVIQANVPATGTWAFAVTVAWDEVSTAKWVQGV